MGICFQQAKLLWKARLRGVSFNETATIAHLRLFLHSRERSWLQTAFKAEFGDSTLNPLANYRFGEFSDEFFHQVLGASSIAALDYSSYEGANTIQDLNQPIGDELRSRFDAVIDGGSLEHIFNFPVAIANLMKMLKVGGTMFLCTAANNLCGHGFYQFSPELMFRIFTEENGFTSCRVILSEARFPSVEKTSDRAAYEANDPATVGGRIGLVSRHPVEMMVEARKVEDLPLFRCPLVQSDYVVQWNESLGRSKDRGPRVMLRHAFDKLPRFCDTECWGIGNSGNSLLRIRGLTRSSRSNGPESGNWEFRATSETGVLARLPGERIA